MKAFILSIIVICIAGFVASNRQIKDDDRQFSSIYEIPKKQYYISDYMPEENKICYGNWKAISTSGGFDGKGFDLDFDHLILKENGIFAFNRNDTLLAYGKMVLLKKNQMLNCKFVFDKKAKLEMANDNEKYMMLTHIDTLLLVAPCCDRYNIKLARER